MRFTLNSTVGLFAKNGNYFKRKISAALRKGEMVLMKQEDGTFVAVQSTMPKTLKLYDPARKELKVVPVQKGMTPGYPLSAHEDQEYLEDLYGEYGI